MCAVSASLIAKPVPLVRASSSSFAFEETPFSHETAVQQQVRDLQAWRSFGHSGWRTRGAARLQESMRINSETEASALGAAELRGRLPGDARRCPATAPGCERRQQTAKQLLEEWRLSSQDTEPLKFKLCAALIASARQPMWSASLPRCPNSRGPGLEVNDDHSIGAGWVLHQRWPYPEGPAHLGPQDGSDATTTTGPGGRDAAPMQTHPQGASPGPARTSQDQPGPARPSQAQRSKHQN